MQNKTKLALAAGIAGLIGLGTAGAAQADWDGHHGFGRGMCGMAGLQMGGMHPGMGFWFHQLMERYDTNQDGKISQEEIDKNRADWLARFDTDKDGALSLKEFEALWLEAHRLQMVRDFQFLDRDGDAKVTLDEYKAPLAHLVRDHDRNGDGFLSKDDRPGSHMMSWHNRGGDNRPKGGADGPDNQDQGPDMQQQ